MNLQRAMGLLLHPTSLPGRYGIGEINEMAYRWVDTLVRARQRIWQILPLGPTGYGDSPYQTHSAFAGNPLLIDLEALSQRGYVPAETLANAPAFPAHEVDYGGVIAWKKPLLREAFDRFDRIADEQERAAFEAFCAEHDGEWLHDYALFMALKRHFGGGPWNEWPVEVRRREPEVLLHYSMRLAGDIMAHKFQQYLFFRQWSALKAYANERGILIMGDIPIYVAYDSADVWANQHLFCLDEDGLPTEVAGVPPDYFSETGQLWGNPLYRWDVMASQNFAWWVARVRHTLRTVDIIRLDHFRGFESYWAVPYGEPTAVDGRWVKGPGAALFTTLKVALGDVPFVAEDLGMITPEVIALRDRFGFPGMRILQFAFDDGPANEHLPHNYTKPTVVYTGTHDNDTTRGWYEQATPHEREMVRRYLGYQPDDVAWALMRLGAQSPAVWAIFPVQDVLSLGSDARMNYPGRPGGNWRWRLLPNALTQAHLDGLAELATLYGRASA
nr:4-alpha-glucanotransferase [Ardenticatena sp.]